jgi:hypothetical protein
VIKRKLTGESNWKICGSNCQVALIRTDETGVFQDSNGIADFQLRGYTFKLKIVCSEWQRIHVFNDIRKDKY